MKSTNTYWPSRTSGLSLIELLVALSVLALIVAIIIPKFLNVQKSAKDTVAQQIASELNSVYANWTASGGITGSGPFLTKDFLTVFSSETGVPATADSNAPDDNGTGLVKDSNTSINVRATGINGFTIFPSLINGTNDGSFALINNQFVVWFDNEKRRFNSLEKTAIDDLSGIVWNGIGGDAGYGIDILETGTPKTFVVHPETNWTTDLNGGTPSNATVVWSSFPGPNSSQTSYGVYNGQLYKILVTTTAVGQGIDSAPNTYGFDVYASRAPDGMDASKYPVYSSDPDSPPGSIIIKMN